MIDGTRAKFESELVQANLALVQYVTSEIAHRVPSHVNRGDLVSAGMLGLAQAARSFDPERGTLFITGSEKLDHRVTEAFEMTFNGSLTGVTIPFGNLDSTITGISIRGDDLVAVGTGAFAEMFRLKAFSEASKSFIRGDADGNGAVNLSDAIVTLIHLFRGGPSPQCEDAADADDNGQIQLTDAIRILGFLFLGSAPPNPPGPPPSPCGADPSEDGFVDKDCVYNGC